MISIDIDDREVIAALTRLRDRAGDAGLKPALALIGEHLVETTKRRFDTSTAPDGSHWAPNAESTLLALMRRAQGGRGDGRLANKRTGGTKTVPLRALSGKRPLVDTGQLADTIRWQPIPDGVAVGTDRFANLFDGGAAVHQFGSKDGRIPARPFLGISTDDRDAILAIVEAHLSAV